MNKEDKYQLVQDLAGKFKESSCFYLADIAELSVNETNDLRKQCYKADISLQVVKNTLVKKALEQAEITDVALLDAIVGPTSVMFSEDMKAPVNVIKEMRKTKKKPVLKAAYVEEAIYIGDDKIETLSKLKSKDEIIGDIVGMLQSPAQNVISALQAPMKKIASILSEEGEGTVKDLAKK